jgi:hypothetical protein
MDIIQGEDRTVRLVFSRTSGPYDLTGASELAVAFPGRTGKVTKLLSLGAVVLTDPTHGIIDVTISDTDTGLMAIGEDQRLEVTLDFGSNRRVFQPDASINIWKKILP